MAAAARTAALAAFSTSDSACAAPQLPKAPQSRPRLSFAVSGFLGHRVSRHLYNRSRVQELRGSRAASWSPPVNEVAVDGSANAAVATSNVEIKAEAGAPEDVVQAKEASISAVMADVANLVKLVDSRDIVELELKHLDYELVIRKKEALPLPPAPPSFSPPQMVGQVPYPAFAPPPPPPSPSPATSSPAPTTAPAAAAPAAPAAPAASDLPRILSPMAGTFYKSPAPGEPAFVKVGDRVQKGQVICIVEAMKLMNEIEADQTGTIVEFLADDGKPVAVDTPLFTIKP